MTLGMGVLGSSRSLFSSNSMYNSYLRAGGFNNAYKNPASTYTYETISSNASSGFSSAYDDIAAYLDMGDYDRAQELYEELKNDIKVYASKYYNYSMSNEECESIANAGFANSTRGSYKEEIRNSANGSFMTGVWEGIPIVGLFLQGDSKAEVTAKQTGKGIKWTETAKEITGSTLSGAAVGAVIGTCFGPGIGTLIGAAAGAILGVGQWALKQYVL